MAETHDLAVGRMAQAGVTPVTWAALGRAWHRSGAREATVAPTVRPTGWGAEGTPTGGWGDDGLRLGTPAPRHPHRPYVTVHPNPIKNLP